MKSYTGVKTTTKTGLMVVKVVVKIVLVGLMAAGLILLCLFLLGILK